MSIHNKEVDDSSINQTMHERFILAEKLIQDVEGGRFAMRDLQPRIKEIIPILEQLTREVSSLALFASNESIDELPTSSLPYMMLPCYLGILHHNRIADIDQKPEILTISQTYYRNFLTILCNYGLVSMVLPWETEEEGEESLPKRDPSMKRNGRQKEGDVPDLRGGKLERYRIMQSFRITMAESKKLYDQNNEDDSALRELWIAKLRLYAYRMLDELQSINDELPLLEMMIKRRNVEAEGEEATTEVLQPTAPLKPFIIARTEHQKQVLGVGYPSIPTMTVDEWYQQRFANHAIPGSSNPSASAHAHSHRANEECNSGNEDNDVEDETKRLSQIAMDEYKDTHRRGWGNTHNKG